MNTQNIDSTINRSSVKTPYSLSNATSITEQRIIDVKENNPAFLMPLEAVKRNLDVKTINCLQSTFSSSCLSAILRYGFTPFTATLDRMFFKDEARKAAFQNVRANGIFKGGIPASLNTFIGTFAYMAGISLASSFKGTSYEQAKNDSDGKICGSILNAICTHPLENRRIKLQQGIHTTPLRGLGAGVLLSLTQFGLGFTLGNNIKKQFKAFAGNKHESYTSFVSNLLGLTICNFISSPLFNMTRHMRVAEKPGVLHGLRKLGWAHNPASYCEKSAEVSKATHRFILGLPLKPKHHHEKVLHHKQRGKLNLHAFMKNYKNGWKCFAKALPVIVVSNAIMALALEYSNTQEKSK